MRVRDASRTNGQDLMPLGCGRERKYFNKKIKYLKMFPTF